MRSGSAAPACTTQAISSPVRVRAGWRSAPRTLRPPALLLAVPATVGRVLRAADGRLPLRDVARILRRQTRSHRAGSRLHGAGADANPSLNERLRVPVPLE